MKLRKVTRLDSIRLDKNDRTYFTEEGYLVDHPILTSVGIFEYINEDGSIRRELRLPEHVFDNKSLETYKGKPIIITHDGGVISKDNVDKEQIGTIMSAGYKDGDNVRAEIIIHDTNAMKKSGLKELSLGYNLELIEEPGEWNGQPYDAIQTNIEINHLALVESARAGEQARLNIDSRKGKSIEGGNEAMANAQATSNDDLEKKLEEFKARKEQRKAAKEQAAQEQTDGKDVAPNEEDFKDDGEDLAEGKLNFEKKEDEPVKEDEEDMKSEEMATDEDDKGATPEDIANKVKERRDRRDEEDDPEDVKGAMGVIAQQDSDIDMLLACIEKLLAEKKADSNADCGDNVAENQDGSDDKSKSLNADSADEIFRQRLSICRMGDRLRLDGLENKSIIEGKKAIIGKVLPEMRLDGKSSVYIDAAYDLAVGEINKKKDVNYQRRQMAAVQGQRMDGMQQSMAMSAREKMINRSQGGNE